MDFSLSLMSDEQRQLRASVEALCQGELGELEERIGESDVANREILALLAQAGLLDWTAPGHFGTRHHRLRAPDQMSLSSFCLVRETLARYCPNAELIFTMQGLGAGPISFFGSDDQRRRHLPHIVGGACFAAFALTEPDAGSDVAALALAAVRDGDAYVLNGRKTLISMAPDADVYTVFARTDPLAGRHGLSCFIVEKGMAGFDPGTRLPMMAAHPVGAPVFTDCRVPVADRIGAENDGFAIAMSTLDFFRTTVGACAVGLAQRAFDEALGHAKLRRAFGRSIADFQAVQMKLAAMATDIDAARLLVYRAALTRDRQETPRITLESAQAKWFATEAAQRVIDAAVQIHGGAGVMRGTPVERLYREVRALRIYEGTSEIQQLVIARQLLADRD